MAIEHLEKARQARKAAKTFKKEHTFRTKDGGTKTQVISRKQAISLFCMECMGWEVHPNDCTSPMCPLFPYRSKTMLSQKGDAGTVPAGSIWAEQPE